jgi:hypothetical protein
MSVDRQRADEAVKSGCVAGNGGFGDAEGARNGALTDDERAFGLEDPGACGLKTIDKLGVEAFLQFGYKGLRYQPGGQADQQNGDTR